jgi:glycosyltransferase involved in cell wall biosynthesis
MERLSDLTIIVPVYSQPLMLRKQIEIWRQYESEVLKRIRFIVVDDGSPDPVPANLFSDSRINVSLYRVTVDVPWGRGGARNLGVTEARTDWVLNIDADHALPPESAMALFRTDISENYWYRFSRYRVGRADETRRKDSIPDHCEFGRIKEHIDSHLMKRSLFLSSPYDEDYSGCLGGGTPFLKRMESIAPVKLLPDSVCLHVYTRHAVADASVISLSRDTSEYSRRRKAKERSGDTRPKKIIRFEWSRVL